MFLHLTVIVTCWDYFLLFLILLLFVLHLKLFSLLRVFSVLKLSLLSNVPYKLTIVLRSRFGLAGERLPYKTTAAEALLGHSSSIEIVI